MMRMMMPTTALLIPAPVTKVQPTPAPHMITTLRLLNHHLAPRARLPLLLLRQLRQHVAPIILIPERRAVAAGMPPNFAFDARVRPAHRARRHRRLRLAGRAGHLLEVERH